MRIYLITFLAMLSACTHETVIKSPEGKQIGQALIESGLDHQGTSTAKIGETDYQGTFIESKVYEDNRTARACGRHSQKYKEYAWGYGNCLWKGSAKHGSSALAQRCVTNISTVGQEIKAHVSLMRYPLILSLRT